MRTKKVILEPYGVAIYIATSPEAWDMLELDTEDMVGAVTYRNGSMYVALPEVYNEEITWHEAHHVARIVNGVHGVVTDHQEHEIDAYMQEHVVRLIKSVYFKGKVNKQK